MAQRPREEVSTNTSLVGISTLLLIFFVLPAYSRKMILRIPPPPSAVQHHHHHHVVVVSPKGSPPSPLTMASLLELPKQSQSQSQVPTGSHLQFQSTSTIEGPHSHRYHFHVMPDLQFTPTGLPESQTETHPAVDPDAKNFAIQQSRRLRELVEILQASGLQVDLGNPSSDVSEAHRESQEEKQESHAAHAGEIHVNNGAVVNHKQLAKVLRSMMKKTKSNSLSRAGAGAGGYSWRRYFTRPRHQADVEAGGDLDVPTSTSVIDELRDLLRETTKLKRTS